MNRRCKGRAASKSGSGLQETSNCWTSVPLSPTLGGQAFLTMLLRILLVLASAFIHVRSGHYELYSDLSSERWYLDDSKLIPITCDDGDCTSLFPKHVKHNIAKRAVVQVNTMKDYIKFLLRGNKTKDDDTNTDPYLTGNITLGTTSVHLLAI